MIADASPLIVFARARRLDLLLGTVEIVVPRAVAEECGRGGGPDAQAIAFAVEEGRIQVVPRRLRVAAGLGRGEAQAIALARARGDDEVLMDDRLGRAAAKRAGLRPVGCLGVLLRAVQRGVPPGEVEDALVDLLDAGLWVGPDVVSRFYRELQRARGRADRQPAARSASM